MSKTIKPRYASRRETWENKTVAILTYNVTYYSGREEKINSWDSAA